MSETYISRNDFLRFVQCKKTWHLKNNPPASPDFRRAFVQNKVPRIQRSAGEEKVYEYARSQFNPESEAAQTVPRYLPLNQKLQRTRELLENKTGIIFSGWFEYRGIALYVDVLEMRDAWNAYAIRSGGGGHHSASLDMALQYVVLKNNGIDPGAFWAMYVNKRYRFNGTFNPSQFFRVRDFLPELGEQIALVEKLVEEISRPSGEMPWQNIDIGNHCYQPAPCPFMDACWAHIPENSVFEIATLDRAIKFQLYKRGIIFQKDIPAEEYHTFTPNQVLQIESTIHRKVTVRKPELTEFLNQVRYPVHYLDFESFMPVLPLFKNTHPLEHIPFEYCLYSRSKPEAAPACKIFLAEAGEDPRREFIANLVNDLGDMHSPGSILVYDNRLEIRQLREMGHLFPEFRDSIELIIARIIDLTYPFHKKLYYTPQMKGLYSIKSLLPALFPSMTYDGLSIQNGYMAMNVFESLFYETDPETKSRKRSDLKEYCKMDVLALVEIHRFLEKAVAG